MTIPPQQPPVPPSGWQPPGTTGPAGPPGPPGQYRPGPSGQYPPGPPQPGQPAGWPGQPTPVPVAKRIPEDQPFVLRQAVGKRAALFGGVLVFMLLIVTCPVGLMASSGDVGLLPILVFPGLVLVVCGAAFGFQLWLFTSGGPVLAVGPAGLWIKSRPTRGQAIWLPWEAIDRIYRRRWSLEKMVCVKPRDPRTGGNLGAFTALDSSMQQLVFGTGFTATLNFANRPEQEIMQAINHFAAGRCRVE